MVTRLRKTSKAASEVAEIGGVDSVDWRFTSADVARFAAAIGLAPAPATDDRQPRPEDQGEEAR